MHWIIEINHRERDNMRIKIDQKNQDFDWKKTNIENCSFFWSNWWKNVENIKKDIDSWFDCNDDNVIKNLANRLLENCEYEKFNSEKTYREIFLDVIVWNVQ